MSRCVLPVILSVMLSVGSVPIAFAASNEPQLNFKIYSPEPATSPSTNNSTPSTLELPAESTPATPSSAAPDEAATTQIPVTPGMEDSSARTTNSTSTSPAESDTAASTMPSTIERNSTTPESSPEIRTTNAVASPSSDAATTTSGSETKPVMSEPLRSEVPVEATPSKAAEAETTAPATTSPSTATSDSQPNPEATATGAESTSPKTAENKTLQGYIRVVPIGTKIPIIMDTAVDSETSQEGDEFTARTAEDLNIDGGVAVPAGSIIKGRIAQMNAPKHVNRSGSVALKFDTVTTPDNRQIPLVANLVARGGVVHAKRGLKDIALDTGTVSLPILLGLGIGALAGNSTSSTTTTTTSSSTSTSKITKPEAAMIGAGIGLVVGVAILCAKKGKKVDVRPGDELKIELAEDLRMPMM